MQICKREIFIGITFLLIGLVLGYLYTTNLHKKDLKTNKEITLDIIDNSIAAFEASDALVNNCSEAYSEVAACFSNFGSCNLNKSAQRLSELELEKKQIQTQLREITKGMDLIIANKRNAL